MRRSTAFSCSPLPEAFFSEFARPLLGGSPSHAQLRQAAIVMSTLPRTVAERLQQGLDPQTRAVVQQWMQQIDDIDPLERKRALEVFHSRIKLSGNAVRQSAAAMNTPPRAAAHPDSPRSATPATNVNEPSKDPAATRPNDASVEVPDSSPLSFMNALPAASLATLLTIESSQTVAIVLSKLRPGIAAEVLPELPDDLRLQTLRRLATLGSVADDVVLEVANHFRSSIERPRPDSAKPLPSGGNGVLEAIMAEVPSAIRQRWQREQSSPRKPVKFPSSGGKHREHESDAVVRTPTSSASHERWIHPQGLPPRPATPISHMNAEELEQFAIDRALADPSAAMLQGNPRGSFAADPDPAEPPVRRLDSSDAELRRRLRITLQSNSDEVMVDSSDQTTPASVASHEDRGHDGELSRSEIKIYSPDASHGAANPDGLVQTTLLNERFEAAPATSICRALGQVPTHTAIFALCGMPQSVVANVLAKLPRKKAKEVRRRIENVHDLSLREIEVSMCEVATAMSAGSTSDADATSTSNDGPSDSPRVAEATSTYVAAA